MYKKLKFIKNPKYCLSKSLVITETPKIAFERINLDIPEIPNYVLTIKDELTKITKTYPIKDKSVVNTLLLYFRHYGTLLRIHCDSECELDNKLIKDLKMCTL